MDKLGRRLKNALLIPALARISRPPSRSVHILHIAKTGGTALRTAIETNSLGMRRTSDHTIFFRNHSVHLDHIPVGQKVIFGLRDPLTRFVSAFYSRMRGGRFGKQRNKPDETKAFMLFKTPGQLANALTSSNDETRHAAVSAMTDILHVRAGISNWLGSQEYLSFRQNDVLYVYQQETLEQDFEMLKTILSLPSSWVLPSDPVGAHRLVGEYDRELGAVGETNVRAWYAGDYDLIRTCQRLFVDGGRMSPPRGEVRVEE